MTDLTLNFKHAHNRPGRGVWEEAWPLAYHLSAINMLNVDFNCLSRSLVVANESS